MSAIALGDGPESGPVVRCQRRTGSSVAVGAVNGSGKRQEYNLCVFRNGRNLVEKRPNWDGSDKIVMFALILTHFAVFLTSSTIFGKGDFMGFLLGIYDPDVIEAAFGRDNSHADHPAESRATGAMPRDQLKQDWSELVGKFSWRAQPVGSSKAAG